MRCITNVSGNERLHYMTLVPYHLGVLQSLGLCMFIDVYILRKLLLNVSFLHVFLCVRRKRGACKGILVVMLYFCCPKETI